MSLDLLKQKIENLRNDLNNHNYNYYILDKQLISDFEYDEMMNRLKDLENKYPQFNDPNSPTQRVGGKVLDNFKTSNHSLPMLSLENTYNENDLLKFDERILKKIKKKKNNYVCELKYDGVAISITYINGLLVQALTRGDGLSGDDVTENIKTIKSIPLKLIGTPPKKLEVRGEIFIDKKSFEKINSDRLRQRGILKIALEKELLNVINENDITRINKKYTSKLNKLEPFSNPRNFASGSIKLLDPSKVSSRNLSCIFYNINVSDNYFENHYEALSSARNWGFEISQFLQISSSIKEVFEFTKKIEKVRNSLPFEIDGVVIKVNNFSDQLILGNTSKSPRWAISYKFKSTQAETILKDVVYQVGRTGAITPVAILEPVFLSGSTIRRASLHNDSFIKSLDLKIGDTVIIEKGGDVIPKVVSINLDKRDLLCSDIKVIEFCPSCETKLIKPKNEVNLYCVNSISCRPQILNKIEHFISRDALDISSIGSKTVEMLFDEGKIINVSDLYKLKLSDFINLNGFGSQSSSFKKAQNIIDGINSSKSKPFDKLIFGLGIRYVGKTVAKKLSLKFKNIANLKNACFNSLIETDEIGDKIANSVLTFFSNEHNIRLINSLSNSGLNFTLDNNSKRKSSKLNGLKFVISGTFNFSREELVNIIEQNDGQLSSSISKNTDYLIEGNNPGPKKIEKANLLGVKIITKIKFLSLLND